MSIKAYLKAIKEGLPDRVRLVVVSKTRSIEEIMEAYDAGQRDFGENKAQELAQKAKLLPADIQWHFIGHLQTNKVKYITPYVHMIHSIDSIKLLQEVNKEGKKKDRIVDCLLQFHIANEETKFGMSMEEADDLLSGELFRQLLNVRIRGVMGMASFIENMEEVRKEFKALNTAFSRFKVLYFADQEYFTETSMGMTLDYSVAIEEGSTMVRLGTAIFGER